MSDILKKVQKIDDEDMESNNSFMDKSIEDYKKISDMLKTLSVIEETETYSSDMDRFNDDCSNFIKYIRQCVENDDFCVLYMLRQGNVIIYGKYDHGIKKDKHTIEMISNEDLKKLYELLQSEFSSDFVDGCKHTFGKGWSLNPTIGENVIIDIDSNNYSDSNWFYEESHKEQKSELPKKK